jgi:uncharacterized protein YbbK (DUF523 family)
VKEPRKARRVRIGISACLLGREVRYDGGHKRDRSILASLGRRFELVPVCPELELGLGVPREPLRLEGGPDAPRLVFRHSRQDITRPMNAFARRRLRDLATTDLRGFVLKSRSPSCGLERVPLHQPGRRGAPALRGRGLFAGALRERFPSLPVVEEQQLHDRAGREDFVRRVLAFKGQA